MNSKILAIIAAILILASCGTKKPAVNDNPKKPKKELPGDTASEEALPTLPDKELRAVWVATIGGIDWPNQRFDEASQKAWYRQMLDTLQRLNVNTVFFQVRPKADAFYDSPYEPWTQYVTGRKSVKANYDVLRWIIDETHSRGMSLHAWINPYRISTRKTARGRFETLDAKIPKSLVKDYRLVRIYNPALPETRQRLRDIIADMLTRYDFDGLHIDDYFYPALEKGEKMNDQTEYRRYGQGYATIEEFRRAMVDSMVVGIRHTVDSVRPGAVFSVSPQGNFQNNYHTMYADIALWSSRGWCDLVIPQLYWSTERWFAPRLKWFSENATDKTRLAIGYGLYRFDRSSRSSYYRTADDLGLQLSMAHKDRNVIGSCLYSAVWLMKNPVGINDTIAAHCPTLKLAPYLGQGEELKPAAPACVTLDGNILSWQPVDGCYYAIYQSNQAVDNNTPQATLIAITYSTAVSLAGVSPSATFYVTAVRKGNNAESLPKKAQ